ISNNTESALLGLNLMLKVLGKEFEEEPFFKRVFLNITCKTSIRVPPLWECFLFDRGFQDMIYLAIT
ncbi:hypothetical protein, partial [Ruminococcus sp.]|uniref:hypothetical protein n=1 Tax=Ruminococcus sp. TaxID=41978 RepID=UPI0025D5977F